MQNYHVSLTTMAYMRGNIEVRAENLEDAKKKALQQVGDIEWRYDGVCEQPGQGPEVQRVEPMLPANLICLRAECIDLIYTQFDLPHERVCKDVYAQGTDPGGWAPKALLTVHLESGIPDVFYYLTTAAKWEYIEQQLSKFYGKEVYFESINPAVTALYEV